MAEPPLQPVTANPALLHLVGGFIALSVLVLLRYLIQSRRLNQNRSPVTAGGFVVLALVAVAIVGACCALLGLQYVDVGCGVGLGAFAGLLSPVAAVSFLSLNLLLRPWEYAPGNPFMMIMTRSLAALTLMSWVLQGIRRRRMTIRWSRACTLYSMLVGWIFFVSAVADLGESAADIFSTFFPISVVALVVMNVLEDETDISVYLNCVTLGICGAIAAALVDTMTSPLYESTGLRLQGAGQYGNANDLASLIVLAFPFLFIRNFLHAKTILEKLGSLTGAIILITGLMVSQSRGAMIALGAAAVTYAFAGGSALKKLLMIGAMTVLIGVMIGRGFGRQEEEMEMSRASRWNYVVTAILMLKDHPAFGVGFGRYPKLYETYTQEWFEGGERTAHSSWVLILAEAGPIGFTLFVWLFWIALRGAASLRAEHPEFLLSVVSYGIAMSFLSHVYLILPYLLIAIVLAAARVYRRGAPPEAATTGVRQQAAVLS